MARRIDIKNILQGILGSFVSRNNDLNGYWAIGKLYKTAVEHEKEIVTLNLLKPISSIETHELNCLTHMWSEKFLSELEKYKIPRKWIISAKISANYSNKIKKMPASTSYPVGDTARYKFEIKTDTETTYRQSKLVKCWQHDPAREQKRK